MGEKKDQIGRGVYWGSQFSQIRNQRVRIELTQQVEWGNAIGQQVTNDTPRSCSLAGRAYGYVAYVALVQADTSRITVIDLCNDFFFLFSWRTPKGSSN